MRVFAMELFTKLFGDLLLFVYHCFDRIVIHGYLSGLSRPEQVVHFFRKVVGIPVLSKEILAADRMLLPIRDSHDRCDRCTRRHSQHCDDAGVLGIGSCCWKTRRRL